MKITILDGNALNPGDLSWEPLKSFGELIVYPRTALEQTAERIGDSDAVLINKVEITDEILEQCPKLRYIGIQATGFNVVDIEACKKRGITVTNVPSYSSSAIAELVFAFIGEFAFKIRMHSESVAAGEWTRCQDFCYWKAPLIEIEGKTMGIFGYGHIGSRVAKIAQAFGMRVIVCTRTAREEIENRVDISTLFNESDFISLHVPLTDKTRNVVNKTTLALMKNTAYLINTARGGLVNEQDLREFLDDERIAGYAADVVCEEPMKADNPLLGAKNCIITPHIGWTATETRQRLIGIVINNVKSFVLGKPLNVVS